MTSCHVFSAFRPAIETTPLWTQRHEENTGVSLPRNLIDGVELYWELTGQSGPVLVLVHGAWADHGTWDALVPYLEDSFRVLTYDRRGHSQSERPSRQGSIRDDESDLASLIAHLDLPPGHLIGNSYGGMVALRLAADQPELVRSVIAHEPPFLELNDAIIANEHVAAMAQAQTDAVELMQAGRLESGTRAFMEAALRPGIWADFSQSSREFLVSNAPSFIDDINDPEPWTVDLEKLAGFPKPILLTQGELSPHFYAAILSQLLQALPRVQKRTVPGAEHVPHISHPREYAEIIRAFINRSTQFHR